MCVAVESGAITSIAISADHLVIAGGHANGSIFTWEAAKSARPFLHIPSLDPSQVVNHTLDGHIPSVPIRHLGFLATRHTALVSADDRGMAFSHLATRGLGAVARTVKTTRILGRYPNDASATGKQRKPSTVLAFAPLPLGNVERETDNLGLTAMLTPYLLVIVSTTPIAQTQHKAIRPKELAAHSPMSGCLAWFPAVKLKVPDPHTGSQNSKVKLVYCWSNSLVVLDVDETASPDKDKPPMLSFKSRSRWKAEEAIVAVQWLSRSVLTVLTITQRLIIIEDGSMRMTDAFDLLHKHIYHQDIFSKQLHNLVEQLDDEDSSMHGVVADAFYMSFRAYKSRMFLLGFNDVSIGTLSNWADRLVALMEDGDYIQAIRLATTYYTGDAEKLTIGLPEDQASRHTLVRNKLLEIMLASMNFTFAQRRKQESYVGNQSTRDLAEACVDACLSIEDVGFLFEEVYERFNDEECEGIFVETLEPLILDGTITTTPPSVVKAMVTHYVGRGMESRLEEMICQMDISTFDIDQVTTLCKQHNLYDALIYVWNQALKDYITPLIDLLSLLIPHAQSGDYFTNRNLLEDPIFGVNALKMFPYMSYTLTGRTYPTGEQLRDEDAMNAKAELYWFLFSGKTITWPRGSSEPFLTRRNQEQQPSFPYLRMILKFDAPSFLSAMNEAFEDSFLNDTPERAVNGGSRKDLSEEHVFGLSVNRQYIITILLEVMNSHDFAAEDTIYLDMFIARNLPKFPQYLLLSGTALRRTLAGLCHFPGEDLAEDAQLSAEYLLSIYHPPNIETLMPLFREAGFYRVLKRAYRADMQWSKLLETYFEDPTDRETIFNCITECLRPQARLTKRQIEDAHAVLRAHASELIRLDPVRAAQIIDTYATSLHRGLLESLSENSELRYLYLRTILEPPEAEKGQQANSQSHDYAEQYVQLMCKFDPSHVASYVESVQSSNLRLEKVLPYMEESGVVDAAVILMAREGQMRDAMERLIEHLKKLEAALFGLLSTTGDDMESVYLAEAAEDLLVALQKYTNVGVWLCRSHAKASSPATTTPTRKRASTSGKLVPEEELWLDLIHATVQITRKVSTCLDAKAMAETPQIDSEKLLTLLRTLVQRVFTALLTLTSTPTSDTNISFLRILRAFLTRASTSSPNLDDLRSVLSSIFSAYAYEESILSLANRLLEKDLFINVQSAANLRQRGWRPRGSTCESCGKRVWGPGVSSEVFVQWEEKQEAELQRKHRRRLAMSGGTPDRGKAKEHVRNQSKATLAEISKSRGKHPMTDKVKDVVEPVERSNDDIAQEQAGLGPLVVLACRHIYHEACLQPLMGEESGTGDRREYRCPIDGVGVV